MTDLLDTYVQNAGRVTTLVNDVQHYFFDFYSLDVEGAEWSVLQSIEWARTAFGMILLEEPDGKTDDARQMKEFLAQKGYEFLGTMDRSMWFKNNRFDEIYAGLE